MYKIKGNKKIYLAWERLLNCVISREGSSARLRRRQQPINNSITLFQRSRASR